MCAFCEQEGHLTAPSHPSEAARCASKGIVPATPFPPFSILLKKRYDLTLQRQPKYQRFTLSKIHVQFTPDPKLAG